ncbi:unnamed protein product, partial [Allacma fusca]
TSFGVWLNFEERSITERLNCR